MAENDWAGLAKDIAWVLYPDWDNDERMISPKDGDSVQLRETLTGQRVLFWAEDKGVEVRVTVPDNPIAAARLRSVIESQRTTSFAMVRDYESGRMVPYDQPLWTPIKIHDDRAADHGGESVEEYAREWRTGWRHNADYRDEVAAAIVAVLRDGLGCTPADLRVSAYTAFGPARPPRLRNISQDRPTQGGASARCSGWDEFADRLEWVLTTMPWHGSLDLSVPGKALFMQLNRERDHVVRGVGSVGANAGFDPDEPRDRMSNLGWHWGVPYYAAGTSDECSWLTPSFGFGATQPTMRPLVSMIVATLRDIGEVSHPDELVFEAFSNLAGVDDMSYVNAEFGLSPA
ncbi:TY-Chap domain-containing protein [Nocardia sp. NPDC004123]